MPSPNTFISSATLAQRRLRRTTIDQLSARASYLPDADRLLIEQVYFHGFSIARVAQLTGQSPRCLQRRVTQLLTRVRCPLFKFVAVRLNLLPREVRATAQLVVIEGHSLRRASELTGNSLHRVRQHMRVVETVARIANL